MRCLVVADLHYSLPQFDWVLAVAPHFDLVIVAGDALDIGSSVDFRAQIVVVRKYLAMLSEVTTVMLCSGNHDLDELDSEGEKIARWIDDLDLIGISRDGDNRLIGDTLFTICPWWDGPRTKQKIADLLGKAAAARDSHKWIWVHHAPPANSPTSWGGKRFMGDVELVQWIDQFRPDIVLSGHVHQSPFVNDGSWFDRIGKTWIFNAGHQFGSPPAFIALDLDAGTAFWLSAAGEQVVDLGAPLRRPAERVVDAPDWLRALGRIADQIPATLSLETS